MSISQQVPRILFVDDEAAVLASVQRALRRENYDVQVTTEPDEALKMLSDNRFDLIVSDMRMPSMSGADLLSIVAQEYPETINLLMTGYSDLDSTIKAINDGHVFRYLSKPWSNGELKSTIQEALKQRAMHILSKKKHTTLSNSVKKLTRCNVSLNKKARQASRELEQTVSFLDMAKEELEHSCEVALKTFSSIINQHIGYDFQTYEAIKDHVSALAEAMQLPQEERANAAYAALFFQIGKLSAEGESKCINDGVSFSTLLEKGAGNPVLTEKMLMPMDNMATVRAIIRHHRENYDGSGYPDKLSDKHIPISARILRVVSDFLFLVHKHHATLQEAKAFILSKCGVFYDPDVIRIFMEQLHEHRESLVQYDDERVEVNALALGMCLSRDVVCQKGILILAKGTYITRAIIERITRYEASNKEKLALYVNNPF